MTNRVFFFVGVVDHEESKAIFGSLDVLPFEKVSYMFD